MQRERKNGKIVIKISIMWFFLLVFVIALLVAFFKNYIFATDSTSHEEEQPDIYFEENKNKIDILGKMVENNYTNTKLVNEQRKINFEKVVEETNTLPKGEKKVKQQGKDGAKQVTALQKYQDNKLLQEEIIETSMTEEPVTEITYLGTSEFLSKYNVHIGEEMYLIETGELKEEPKEDAKKVKSIKRYLNVKLQEPENNGWVKVEYNSKEGYIQTEKLTSETVTPMIGEKNRIAKLQSKLSEKMDLSEPSGLTLSDYKTIFAYDASDKNSIFSDNAEAFYNAEQKYQINGIFLASIGIHESAWGTSKIAKAKNNLFGYGAYDRDPMGMANTFETYADGINTVAEALSTNYLSETGSYYNGKTVKDVNVRYATDKNWHKKVYKYMKYLYDKLG